MTPYEIVDDVLTAKEIEGIERVMRQPFFPWYMQEYTATGDCKDERYKDVPFISHSFISNNNMSSYSDMAIDIVKKFEERSGIQYNKIDRAIGAATFKTSEPIITPPHLDMQVPHRVLLYYVNSSNGQTLIYKKDTDYEELGRVNAIAGRFLLLDGSYWHSAKTCTNNNYRIIINYNLL